MNVEVVFNGLPTVNHADGLNTRFLVYFPICGHWCIPVDPFAIIAVLDSGVIYTPGI